MIWNREGFLIRKEGDSPVGPAYLGHIHRAPEGGWIAYDWDIDMRFYRRLGNAQRFVIKAAVAKRLDE